jgi:hypothetical protein
MRVEAVRSDRQPEERTARMRTARCFRGDRSLPVLFSHHAHTRSKPRTSTPFNCVGVARDCTRAHARRWGLDAIHAATTDAGSVCPIGRRAPDAESIRLRAPEALRSMHARGGAGRNGQPAAGVPRVRVALGLATEREVCARHWMLRLRHSNPLDVGRKAMIGQSTSRTGRGPRRCRESSAAIGRLPRWFGPQPVRVHVRVGKRHRFAQRFVRRE